MVSPALPSSGSVNAAKAILMMVAAAGILTVNDAIAKWLTERYPVGQVLAMRGILVVAMVYAWAVLSGRGSALRVKSWSLHLTRGGLMAVSTFLFVTSLWLLPIADAIAISFAGPIFATALQPRRKCFSTSVKLIAGKPNC